MTNNNHPAHGPVSLERLHQISEILSKAAAQSDGGNLGYAMADAVKAIDELLSVRKTAAQEAVYQVLDDGSWTDYSKQQLDVLLESKPSTLFRVAYPSPSLTQLAPVVADAVKVIDGAIASFGAETVAWVRYCSDGTIDGPLLNYHIDDCRKSTWTPLYASPQLPQSAPVSVPDEIDKWQAIDDIRDHDESFRWDSADGYEAGWNACRAALLQGSQPVSNRDELREQVRREHAEWSDATFGDVGPVGPLKHLSKEALEAAVNPEDSLEWADMQLLLWDAQRRMGLSDDFITRAMIEKLAINKTRQWPEPKDGEPRLHIKEQSESVFPEVECDICGHVSTDPEGRHYCCEDNSND